MRAASVALEISSATGTPPVREAHASELARIEFRSPGATGSREERDNQGGATGRADRNQFRRDELPPGDGLAGGGDGAHGDLAPCVATRANDASGDGGRLVRCESGGGHHRREGRIAHGRWRCG